MKKKTPAKKVTRKKTTAKKASPKKAAPKKTALKKKPAKKKTTKKRTTVHKTAGIDQALALATSKKVLRALKKEFPEATTALHYDTPEQLLVATILSAQCTDVRVNIVTKDLFKKAPTPAHLANMPLPALEKAVQSTGFFRNKAKNISACCRELVEKHDGQVPPDMDILVKLPGVGRKTANCVLGSAFGMATGVVVDTHVLRISRRLGLTVEKDPVKMERDLIELLPKRDWLNYSHRIILHGRKTCVARKPKCDECSMKSFCPRIGVGE